jgi:tetratricopeptide (TPR) repeat protein
MRPSEGHTFYWKRIVWAGVFAAIVVTAPLLYEATLINAASVAARRQTPGSPLFSAIERGLGHIVASRPSPIAYRKLAHLRLLQNDPQTAAALLEKATQLAPNDPIVALQFGDTLEALGDRDRAIFQWQRASLSAGYLATHGPTYRVPGQSMDERDHMMVATQVWPLSSNAWFQVARLHLERGEAEAAMAAFTKALDLARWTPEADPYVSEYWARYYLGTLLLNAESWDHARAQLLACLDLIDTGSGLRGQLAPGNVHYLVGVTSFLLGDYGDAIHHLSRASALGVGGSETALWLDRARQRSG